MATKKKKKKVYRAHPENVIIMATYYPSICNTPTEHSCDPCEAKEYGRVRSSAFVAKDFVWTDKTSAVEWAAGIASGDIIVIPETHGEVPDPSEILGAGYGDTVETLIGYNFTGKYFDPNYKTNCEFYNSLKKNRNYLWVYRTSNSIHFSTATVTIIPKANVQDDLTSLVDWNITVKWMAPDLPCPIDIPEGIFDSCYDPN